jgi:hypothetical protein
MHSIVNEIVNYPEGKADAAGRMPGHSSHPVVSLLHIAPSRIHPTASALYPAALESP